MLSKPVETWIKEFNDWEYMTLKEDLVKDKHFYLMSVSNWQKLLTAFGGAPEIPFQQYIVEQKENETVTKVTKHDFSPIKVKVRVLDPNINNLSEDNGLTVLTSKYLGVRTFIANVST